MSRAQLTRHQWRLLVGTLAEYCDGTRQPHTLGHQVAELEHHMRTYEEPAHV